MKKKTKIVVLSVFIVLLGVAIYPLPDNPPVKYVERYTGETKTEKVEGEKWLVWLYNNPVGELSLQTLVKRKFVSDIYGRMMDAPRSAKKVPAFVKKYDIDLRITQKQHFDSFNDFFVRKLKPDAREINPDPEVVVSPDDGKILVFEDIGNQDFFVKGHRFNIYSFLSDSSLAEKYLDGSLMIIRLAPPDYHRFHFPVNGSISALTKVRGDYFSVSPIALRKIMEVFCLNKREYVEISTRNFGEVIMAEVGATMVGTIIQTYNDSVAVKGEEKGYFKFGGSTVILIFENGKIRIDEDLVINSRKKLETTVILGERIAVAKMVLDSI